MSELMLFNRQHSSTAAYPSKKKVNRSKLRRCSSADENQTKGKLFTKFDAITSDNDSGIEDLDQQINNDVRRQTVSVELDDEESTPSFGACEDEDDGESSNSTTNQDFPDSDQSDFAKIFDDLALAALIPDEEKKEFCCNTCTVFHAEFARRISFPVSFKYPGLQYHLFVEDGVNSDPCGWPNFAYVKLDNAKAQFRCPNPHCGRLWTSMRARISFAVSYPISQGFVVLKLFGQNCQSCESPADALWYMEEVCRVVENLSQSIFERYFPSEIMNEYLQSTDVSERSNKYSQRASHDPRQRKGKMLAQHDKTHCEACQRNLCFN